MAQEIDREALRARAEDAVAQAHGDEWRTMFSGYQEALIETWIDGYIAACTPGFRVTSDIFGAWDNDAPTIEFNSRGKDADRANDKTG